MEYYRYYRYRFFFLPSVEFEGTKLTVTTNLFHVVADSAS